MISGYLLPAAAGHAYANATLSLAGASGGGAWSTGAGTPSWLSINASTGAFTGTAPPMSFGINGAAGLRPARAGVAYSSPAFTTYGGAGGGAWGLGAGAPAWLTINASTGAFGGSP